MLSRQPTVVITDLSVRGQSLLGAQTVQNRVCPYDASDEAGIAAISKTIDLRFKIVSQHTEVTGLFSAGGVVLLLAGALLSVLWFGRVV